MMHYNIFFLKLQSLKQKCINDRDEDLWYGVILKQFLTQTRTNLCNKKNISYPKAEITFKEVYQSLFLFQSHGSLRYWLKETDHELLSIN